MSNVPSDLRYVQSHEWLRSEPDGLTTVGITDYAQSSLGDITYVQLPQVGTVLAAGDVLGVVESVKAASDLYAPVAGEVVAVNRELEANPEILNQAPYEGGWLLKLRPTRPEDVAALLDADGYRQLIA